MRVYLIRMFFCVRVVVGMFFKVFIMLDANLLGRVSSKRRGREIVLGRSQDVVDVGYYVANLVGITPRHPTRITRIVIREVDVVVIARGIVAIGNVGAVLELVHAPPGLGIARSDPHDRQGQRQLAHAHQHGPNRHPRHPHLHRHPHHRLEYHRPMPF